MILTRARTFEWTTHSRTKMRQYGLSEARVKRILFAPKRTEEGIAPKTFAMMQPVSVTRDKGQEAWKQELWVMAQDKGAKRVIISAWRYPGVSKPKSPVLIQAFRKELGDYRNLETKKPESWTGVPRRKIKLKRKWILPKRPIRRTSGSSAIQLD